MNSAFSTVASAIIVIADVIKATRAVDDNASRVDKAMTLTAHERRCVLRYRGRNIAQRLGIT